jgi:[citrate (pro-3S)-lyase] ligase
MTDNYNLDMKYWLQEAQSTKEPISVVELPRMAINSTPVSASAVRRLLTEGDFDSIKNLVPATTLDFLEMKYSTAAQSAEGAELK